MRRVAGALEKMTNRKRTSHEMGALVALLLFAASVLTACNPEANPVTPEKMQEIRKQESQQRENFHPDTNAPKPGA